MNQALSRDVLIRRLTDSLSKAPYELIFALMDDSTQFFNAKLRMIRIMNDTQDRCK